MPERTYVVGVPMAITVHENGAVTFDVDLSEVSDFTEHVEDDQPDEVVLPDVSTVEAAAARLANTLTITLHPVA